MEDNNELTNKIAQLIASERKKHPEDIHILEEQHAPLIAQIVSNYNLKTADKEFPRATLIYLGAPTGAGKDTLARNLTLKNKDKNFVILNMDMFRHYHTQIVPSTPTPIPDKDFATTTNQSSYEIYHIIQEFILQEYPGTNIMLTGTMRDLEWIRKILKRYKTDKKTNYEAILATLAVSAKESAFSIFERYLHMVDKRGTSTEPLRYTSLSYHNDTISKFNQTVAAFEEDYKNNSFKANTFDSIQVYRRTKDILDPSEDTLVYDSEDVTLSSTAVSSINKIIKDSTPIDGNRILELLNIVERNSAYLKGEHLYKSLLQDLKTISKPIDKDKDDISM